MATTTNYGWQTPDDFALVKDGASAIRSLGSSVDTTTKALNPSTTLGDIEYRSSTANTNTRLPIGSSGQILTVASGVPSWATASSGGMTLLATATPSGASSLEFTGISGSYTNLLLTWKSVYQSASGYWSVRFNSDSGTNYVFGGLDIQNGTLGNFYSYNTLLGNSNSTAPIGITGTSDVANTNSYGQMQIYDYSDTTVRKNVEYRAIGPTTGTIRYPYLVNGVWTSTSAITSINFLRSDTQTITGKFYLYGVK
jgi:hypothetical protein